MSLVTRARPAQVSRAVNMRARPKSGSQKLMVIPRGANVQLVGCKVWCEIIYKGRHGYVYKDFLGGARSATAAGKPKAVKTAQAKTAKARRARPRRARPSRSIPARPISRALPGVEVPKAQAAFVPAAMTRTLPTATSARPAIA